MMRDLFAAPEPAPATSPAVRTLPDAVPAQIIDGHEVQRCAVCRGWASFGYGRDMKRGRPGVWFCGPHRPFAA